VYEFVGAPEFNKAIASRVVKQEPDAEEHEEHEAKPTSNSTIPNVLPLFKSSSPTRIPIANTNNMNINMVDPDRPKHELGRSRIPYIPAKTPSYIAGPTDGTLKPLGMTSKAMQGSPYFDIPAAAFRSNPRPTNGDLAARLGITTKRNKATEELSARKHVPPKTLLISPPRKRRCPGPFASSSSPGGSGLLAPRKQQEKVKVEEQDDEVELQSVPEKEFEDEEVFAAVPETEVEESVEEASAAEPEPEPELAPKMVKVEDIPTAAPSAAPSAIQ
jgi:hypothetical protein